MVKIKTVLLSVAGVAVVAAGSGAAAAHYNQYKDTKQHNDAVAAASAAQKEAATINAVQKSADVRYSQLSQAYASLKAQCQKGVAAYDTLAPSIRIKLPAPVCQ